MDCKEYDGKSASAFAKGSGYVQPIHAAHGNIKDDHIWHKRGILGQYGFSTWDSRDDIKLITQNGADLAANSQIIVGN
jgi:hypothetical protein